MKRGHKKWYKGVRQVSFVALAAPLAVMPWMSIVEANSNNYVDRILHLSSNYHADGNPAASLYVGEKDIDFTTRDTFRVTLPPGVEWNRVPAGLENATAVLMTESTLVVTPAGPNIVNNDGDQADKIRIPLDIKVNGATGELKVKVEPMDSTITSGEYTFAIVRTGKTIAVADTVEAIGETEADTGIVRIEEASPGQITRGSSTPVTFRLPSQFEWRDIKLTGTGGFTGATFTNIIKDGNTLRATLNIPAGSKDRGFLYVKPRVKPKDGAVPGDVYVSISGTELSDAEVVVAKYQKWGANIKVEQVNQILSSKFDDKKVVKMTIEETSPGAFIGGREVEVEFPSTVKIVGTVTPSGNIVGHLISYSGSDVRGVVNSDSNRITFTIPSTSTPSSSKRKLVFEAAIAVKTGTLGDIEATVEGAGIEKQKVLVAKVIPPVIPKAAGEGKLRIGLQGQEAPDIFLAETMPGAIRKAIDMGPLGTENGFVVVYLPKGVTYTTTPKVEVIEGDLKIDTASVQIVKAESIYDAITFNVKAESTKPSKIRISGIKLGLDRSVPEGVMEAKVAGYALSHPFNSKVFNVTTGSAFQYASVITPAPTDTKMSGSFTIGSTIYRIGDNEKVMDAAPYIKDDRTYLPVRYVAEVLGVGEKDIVWDKAAHTVTLFKGDKVVQIKVGERKIMVNGTVVPTDVVAEIKNERMMLPVYHVVQALGAKARWDAESQTVFIE
ncbi:copper amine oxidase N-terminal domain-containing protein [Aneurinibacillus thermoaerophilus]|uniref:copper amine oxidase N-terminal domain-containing protein n=1 Tax=Aneurinibacillus thermoaerophilus TaxID=143495 RepID=UPI002E21F534|nr:copper amine oxidase N-terminal domain-containing protein [Aneurinibacillus thermoaerophilus]